MSEVKLDEHGALDSTEFVVIELILCMDVDKSILCCRNDFDKLS